MGSKPPSTPNGHTIHDSLGGLASRTGSGVAAVLYTCSYSEVMSIALQCSTVSAADALTPLFCTSDCAKKLLPFGRQCSSSMGASLSAFGLAQTVDAMLSHCDGSPTATPAGPAPAPATECPFDQIVAQCSDVTSVSQAEAMCTSPCVQNIVGHYDACAASSDPRVQSLFSASNWGPLVSICRESSISSAADSNIDTQCASIQTDLTRQLTEVCCSDPLCAAAPTSCSRSCSGILIPFYHSCASEIMTSSPALFARLTGLASICSNEASGGH